MRLSRKLNQTIVYWAPDGIIDLHGGQGWAGGVEIKGRWQEQTEEVLNADGKNELSRAVIYLDGSTVVGFDGRFYLGELDDLTSGQQADPAIVVGTGRVIAIGDSPDLRGRGTSLKKVWVK